MRQAFLLIAGCTLLMNCSSDKKEKPSAETTGLEPAGAFENPPATGSNEMIEGTMPSTIDTDPSALCVDDCKGMKDQFTWPDAGQ